MAVNAQERGQGLRGTETGADKASTAPRIAFLNAPHADCNKRPPHVLLCVHFVPRTKMLCCPIIIMYFTRQHDAYDPVTNKSLQQTFFEGLK